MWDIIGKPLEDNTKRERLSRFYNERPGGVAFNVALGLSKELEKSGFKLSLVSAIGKNDKTRIIQTILKENNINSKYLIIKGTQNDSIYLLKQKMVKYLDQLIAQIISYLTKLI